MRVALLTYSTRPRGGVVHTLALAEALAALGVDVTVWTLGRGGDAAFFRPVDPAVRLRVVDLPALEDEEVGARIVRSIATLRAAFDEHRAAGGRYDVVHAQDCISANAVDRCVRTIHHLDHFTTPELAACHERAVVRPFAHVCVSAAVAREVEQGWGLRPTVIGNGVEAERFAAAAHDAAGRRRWREQVGGRYVLAVGGIEPRKGSLDLLEAVALLRRDEPDLQLVVAGGETLFDYRGYRAAFDERAEALGVRPQVLGPVDHDALPSLVAGCGALGFVSTQEGFGLAAMEGLAAGVPVVVRELPVLTEVFGPHVRYGSDPGTIAAALREALDAGPLPGGQAFARGHTWAAAARAHLAFYAGLEP
ncbi:glycosyltransferase, MSMEG_0565 family [Friedmanniella luteola]|uniref:Glycosyltransferase, MSMEG_0565 family n=1 Tax=Friedmanniella luteola TaxID=546871 RepID=A0A1H1XXH9_9ACTN|nr:MSMEG_0565 family glycosyltransferase [Friedmanniella luteola]SDT13944.1 glycosyltransferase, MSMEG_0565 family [Friedmanniella luteola]